MEQARYPKNNIKIPLLFFYQKTDRKKSYRKSDTLSNCVQSEGENS
jgi:hypothetical protein